MNIASMMWLKTKCEKLSIVDFWALDSYLHHYAKENKNQSHKENESNKINLRKMDY